MAVRKTTKATEEITVDVEVVDTPVVEEQEVVEVPEVEVQEVEVEEPKKEDVVVDTSVAEVKESKNNGKVKIRMRVDHKCCIAMERYDLKAGKTYTVPENVKRVLNKAGLLAPL